MPRITISRLGHELHVSADFRLSGVPDVPTTGAVLVSINHAQAEMTLADARRFAETLATILAVPAAPEADPEQPLGA